MSTPMVFHCVSDLLFDDISSTLSRFEPSEMLLNVFETVDKIRSTLLAHKCSPQMLQVQTAVKQVTVLTGGINDC